MDTSELRCLGWKSSFESQLSPADDDAILLRVAAHFGSRLQCFGVADEYSLPISLAPSDDDFAVGDWLLVDPASHRVVRRLERATQLDRKAAGTNVRTQLIAANLDTLFIVSSCNQDFNLSRLERYLAVAIEAGITPLVILTKSDLCEDPQAMRQRAAGLKRDLVVELLDARDAAQAAVLECWCRAGQTVGLVGSSGVGKSTLAMTLGAGQVETQGVREDDAKGRHTTTARHMHRLRHGGVLIDTPGMRELQLAECQDGVAELFEDIVALARKCRFRDCRHRAEPGCAIQAAIASGLLEPRRLKSFLKLEAEQTRNSKSLAERRRESRKLGKFYKTVQSEKRERQDSP